MKLVIDTNVYVSALIIPDSTIRNVVDIARNKSNTLLFSHETFGELERVFDRPRLQKRIDKRNLDDFLVQISATSTFVVPNKRVTICRDPRDNMFLELALAGNADYLITGDEDLLVLEEFQGTKIVAALEFLTGTNQS